VSAIARVIGSKGTGFVAEVQHPEPQEASFEYAVEMLTGPRGWRDREGTFHPI
jgi:hypothetical protein